jgi:RND superfamily putative drug exporter
VPPEAPAAEEPQTTRLSIAKNAVRHAVSSAAAATQRTPRPSGPPTPAPAKPREEREIESWLGDLRGAGGVSGAGTPAPPRPSAEPTRAMPEHGSGGNDPTTAIPAPRDPQPQDDDSAEATRAIPTPRKSDADAATEKLNTRADDEPQRRGGSGVSAQDLLRREGRLK